MTKTNMTDGPDVEVGEENFIKLEDEQSLIDIKEEEIQGLSCKIEFDDDKLDSAHLQSCWAYGQNLDESINVLQNNEVKSSFPCTCGIWQQYDTPNENVHESEGEYFKQESEFIVDLDNELLKRNLILCCDECSEEYEDYCTKCHMLVQILPNIISRKRSPLWKETVTKNILEIKQNSNGFGIFSLKSIPSNVILGPFNRLRFRQDSVVYGWKVKDNQLVSVQNLEFDKWMRFVNYADTAATQNLNIFQHKNALYYRTNREIKKGEELLAKLDEDNITNVNNKELCYCPAIEAEFVSVYACTLCCLGFSSEKYLLVHKIKCPYNNVEVTAEDIVQCPTCNLYLAKNEHFESHLVPCSESSRRYNKDNYQPLEILTENSE